jgi:DNA-binding NarL/FixJ family response regulator
MPIRLAIIDDYEVVVRGLAEMLRPYAGEVEVVPMTLDRAVDAQVDAEVDAEVDIALVDTFAPGKADGGDVTDLVADSRFRKVVVYTWNVERSQVEAALERGAAACLSKTASAGDLVEALKRVHAGERVVHGRVDEEPAPAATNGSWPGRAEGLTAREAEVIALITEGLSNQEIAERASLSINSVKSYIRTSYRKMGVTSRTNAVLWGLDHGFTPDRARNGSGRTVAT